MPDRPTLVPADQLAATNQAHFPLMRVQTIDAHEMSFSLRKSNCAVTSSEWPQSGVHSLPGGEIPKDFEFVSETGPVRFSSLFADKDTC